MAALAKNYNSASNNLSPKPSRKIDRAIAVMEAMKTALD